MEMARLELRSWKAVGIAYLVGPMIGLAVLWLLMFAPAMGLIPMSVEERTAFALMMVLGGWVCLVVEVILITPLLLAFRRYRWRWLNGWSGACIGFLLGALPWPLAALIGNPDLDTVVFITTLTAAWKTGVVGLIAAVTFRLIAIRRADEPV